MKTFNLITAVVFTIFAMVCTVAGFWNPGHFIFAIASAILALMGAIEYNQERKEA